MIVDLQVNLETQEGGAVEPEALVSGAKAAGLDGIVLTQEGNLQPDIAAYQAAAESEGIQVFAGNKLATNHGLILCILPDAAELPEDWATKDENEAYEASSVIDAIEARGGVTVALRPYDRAVDKPMGDHLFTLQGLSACEVQNGSVSVDANDLALEAATSMEMPCVGTSCAKGAEGLGTAATLFRGKVSNAQELVEAIREGACWPVTFADALPKVESSSDERRDRGGRGRSRGGRGGRGRDDRRGRGRDDRGPRDDRGNRDDRGGGNRGGRGRDDRGNRDDRGGRGRSDGRSDGRGRGGRGRGGRGRGGPKPDDIGNRVSRRNKGPVSEDAGNLIRPDESKLPPEDIGNRLAPGEASPYRGKGDEETYGNE